MSLSIIDTIPHCDVFHPTNSEFNDFAEYVEKASKLSKSGIFKVGYFI